MFFVAVFVSTSSIFEHIFTLQLCNRCATRIYVWDKNICVTILIWFVASLALFISLLHKQLEKFLLIIVWFSQKFLCFSCRWPGCIFCCAVNGFCWLEQTFQLARMHISVGQHACSVAQTMCSAGQNRRFSWPGCIYPVGKHACSVGQNHVLVGQKNMSQLIC